MVLHGLLYKIMDTENSNQYATLKDVVSSMRNENMFNLTGLLEILNSSKDVDVQVKLFSIISAYLMLKDANIETIVTFSPLYDKICMVLANCPASKTAVAFNFISALLYVDEEHSHKNKSLVAYGRNMIRSSGCLATMCDLFSSCMMHQEAWRALCRCLAEACRGVEASQSYCTHLVPMCVQRCSQRNIEVLMILQSLLQNHKRNINLFVECNGIALFQREYLQHDACLQLLATIAQSSMHAVALIVKADICQQLRDFLHLYGPESQLGQWATIVLYHTSRVEASCEGPKDEERVKVNNKTSQSLLTKMNPISQNRESERSADTTKFFQNVMKEIIQCGTQTEFKDLKACFPSDFMMNSSQRNTVNVASRASCDKMTHRNKVWIPTQDKTESYSKNATTKLIKNERMQFNKTNELSFSFLQKQHLNKKYSTSKSFKADKLTESFQRTLPTNISNVRKKNTVYESLIENNGICTVDANEFKPNFASTPKKGATYEYSRYETQRSNNDISKSFHSSIRNQIKQRLQKKKASKRLERSKIDKEIKHRSYSGRFFDAINTSCTTLVNTVKSIFRPKIDLNEANEDSLNKTPQDTWPCSYSFTNYMRKRDAALKYNEMKCTTESSGSFIGSKSKECFEDFRIEMTNSCHTCNDTVALKRKSANDIHLKQTIRKLKLGINLYGCDFKKISRTMWPNESYMTPAVLYNLYRKLIIK